LRIADRRLRIALSIEDCRLRLLIDGGSIGLWIVDWQLAIGNRQSAIGNPQSAIQSAIDDPQSAM